MPLRIQQDQRAWLADVAHAAIHVELDAVERKRIGRSPVQVPAAIVVLEERRIPRSRRNLGGLRVTDAPGLHELIHAGTHRVGKLRRPAGEEIENAMFRVTADQHRAGTEHRAHQQQAVAIGNRRRRDHAVEGPTTGFDETPIHQIGRTPVAVGQGLEQVVGIAMPDHHRIGAGAIGDLLVQLFEVVAVIDVDRIGIGLPPLGRRGRPGRLGRRGQ